MAAVCGTGGREDRTACMEGVVEKLADYDPAAGRAACESLSGRLRKACRAAAEEKMYRLDKPSLHLYVGR